MVQRVVRRPVDVVLERVTAQHVRVVDLREGTKVSERLERESRGARGRARRTKMDQRLTNENRPMNMYLWIGNM